VDEDGDPRDTYNWLSNPIQRYSYDAKKSLGLADLPPDHVFELGDAVEPAVIVFPNSGCC